MLSGHTNQGEPVQLKLGAGSGGDETVYVQMKKVLLENLQDKFASGPRLRFN